jgi:predicted DNA binding protein
VKLSLFLSIFFVISTNAKEWEFTRNIDLLNDKDLSLATVQDDRCSYRCASLNIRADGEVIVAFSNFMNSDKDITIEYRFDKEEIKTAYLSPSTKGSEGFFKDDYVNNFVAQLMYFNSLVIRSYDYRGTQTTLKFSLKNSKAAISKLTKFSSLPSYPTLKANNEKKLKLILPSELKNLKKVLAELGSKLGKDSDAYKALQKEYIERKALIEQKK